MKIDALEYRGVESLGRENAAALGRVASAKAAKGSVEAGVLSYMAKVGKEFIVRKENAEHAQAKTNTMLKMDAYEKQMAVREFYTADEARTLPAGAVRLTQADGSPRNDIPAYEVYPYLLEQAQKKIIEQESQTISNPMLQEDYLQLANGLASKTNLKTALNAARQQQSYLRNVASDTSMQLAINGKLIAAEKVIVDADFSALETKTIIRELRETDEWESDTRILNTQDLDEISKRLDQLQSEKYGTGKTDYLGPGKSSGPYNVEANLRRFKSVINSVRGANNNANYLRYKELIRSADNGNFEKNKLFVNNQQIAIIKNDPMLTVNQKNKLVMDAGNALYAGTVRNTTRLTPLEDDLIAMGASTKLLQTLPADLNDEQVALNTAQQEAYSKKLEMIKENAAGYLQLYSPAVTHLANELRKPDIQKDPQRAAAAMRNYLFVMRVDQEKIGLTPQEVNFLTPAFVNKFKETAANINKDPLGVARLVEQMELLREQYKNEWPAVYSQLIREKALKPEHVMGDVIKDSSMRINYIQAVENQGEMQKTPFYKNNIKRTTEDVSRATLALRGTLFTGGANATIADGLSMSEQVNSFENGLIQMLLAEGYKTNIYNPASAKQMVNKIVDDNWVISNGVRIPKGQDWSTDDVESGLIGLRYGRHVVLGESLKFVGQDLIDLSPADNQRTLQGRFRNFATPSTNQDESGMIFKWNSGDPVLVLKKGRVVPLTVSFEKLADFGRERHIRQGTRFAKNRAELVID